MKQLKKALSVDMSTPEMRSMRYADIGDWFIEESASTVYFGVKAGKMKNTDYSFLVLLHELVEAYLCHRMGVKGEDVDAFDFAHEDHPEPGSLPDAPYHAQHQIATDVESMLSVALGINWADYEKAIQNTVKKFKKGGEIK